MGKIHLVLGPQGSGKSTYALQLAQQESAVRFSIDEWMQSLFGPDLPKTMSLPWIMERVQRCEARIWATASQISQAGGVVVLDLSFVKLESRNNFRRLAADIGAEVQLHVLDAPYAVRKERVVKRNREKGETFAFEVTPMMFDFMENEFQRPTEEELSLASIV
ncbi:ATP-binding protein [Marinimicrobium sp. ABcell2]|uniref:AAA family ATPase n=1 Tax=Marinimicrobium sp. ABcell2 TaxID=3069751 RepID=UPI0027B51E61|nr:ATP-binding protein [Marinimicrobium sp. ABcell2]MDQ2077975.1 ATP-binding protein [Marinimicrobium sp. ABcell2]